MDDRVSTESKSRMSQLAVWSYWIATRPLAVGVITAAVVFSATSTKWFSDGLAGDIFDCMLATAAVLLILHSFILAPLALILGIVALVQAARSPGPCYGLEHAKVAVIVGLVVCAYVLLMLIEGWPMS